MVIRTCISWATQDLEGDLDAVYDEEEADGLFIDELFELLEANEGLREAICRGRFEHAIDPLFDVAPVHSAHAAGYDIVRLKMWRGVARRLVNWRIIVAVENSTPVSRIRILGLMPRSDDYEPESDFGARVRADYERAGFRRRGP